MKSSNLIISENNTSKVSFPKIDPKYSGQIEGGKCRQEGSFAGNSQDCSTFLMCLFGEYIMMPCGCGLHWDEKIKGCNLIQNSQCLFEDGRGIRSRR